MVAPIIPAVNDAGDRGILEAAAQAGAREAGYVLLRLPLEVRDLFREWLLEHHPDKLRHVLSLVRSTRDGKDYDAKWGERMTGDGPYAWMIGRRFEIAAERLGFNKKRRKLRTDLFTPPVQAGRAADAVLKEDRHGDPRRCITLITLAVLGYRAARRRSTSGLGWALVVREHCPRSRFSTWMASCWRCGPARNLPMTQASRPVLADHSGVTLAQNQPDRDDVDRVIARGRGGGSHRARSRRPEPIGAATAAISPTRTGISGRSRINPFWPLDPNGRLQLA